MAKLVFGMNQSLDGYVDHMAFAPGPTLFRHFVEEARRQAGSVYGRQMYEIMRYWDDDHPDWDAERRAFAAAWRNQPKWVVSRSLKSVGPNARLVENDLEGSIRELKAARDGEIEVAGPDLAKSLTELGLIDEYRIYLHPVVLGRGKPYFAGPRPPLRLMTSDRIGEDVIRLTSFLPNLQHAKRSLVQPPPGREGAEKAGDSLRMKLRCHSPFTITRYPRFAGRR
jgi:dihydrofolate reductase